MLNRLIDLIIQFVDLFRFWSIIDAFEEGLVFTLGRDTRQIGPRNGLFWTGLHFIAPFWIETIIKVNVWYDTANSGRRDLITKDGKTISVEYIMKYRILREKIREFIIDLGDEGTALSDYFDAAIATVVEGKTLAELISEPVAVEEEILRLARNELNCFGFKLYQVRGIGRTTAFPIRVIS